MMGLRIERTFHVGRFGKRKEIHPGESPALLGHSGGRVPRVARLMALALRFEQMVESGIVADRATLARLGHVTRARITQIMNLLQLAPDIQEAILFLPPTVRGRDPIHLAQLQPIATACSWRIQRSMWKRLLEKSSKESSEKSANPEKFLV